MNVKALPLTLMTAAILAACSPNPVVPPVVQPDKAPLEKPAQPTLGTPKVGIPEAVDILKIIPVQDIPGSGQNPPPSSNTFNKTLARMGQTVTATFDSFSKSPEWLDMGRFITNTSVTTGPGMLINPKFVVELARAQAKAQQSGQTLSRGGAGQALSSEAKSLMSRISALAAASGPNPLPTGTWKPKVGTKAGNPANWEQVSATPTDGVKFEAMDSGKKFTLETAWKVGGKATLSVPLELGPVVLSQELPTALKTTLSIDSKVVLELTANLDYGTCLSRLGPVGLDLTLKAPSGLDVAVKYARSSSEISGSVKASLVSGGRSVALDSSGSLKGSFSQDAACGIKLVPSSYNTSSSLKAGSDSFESKLNVVNIKGLSLNSADMAAKLENVDGFVSASAQLNDTVMLSAYGPLEDTNKDKTPGDKLEIKFSNGDNLYTTTLEALLKSTSQPPIVPAPPLAPKP